MRLFDRKQSNSGISLIELIIVIAIIGVLTGILAPAFTKYVEKSKKAKDIYTADQIARAVNIAFVENPEAYDAFQKWGKAGINVSATYNGTYTSYSVYCVASSGPQNTNKVSNCFNGSEGALNGGKNDGSAGFYGAVNRELGLSTTKMNPSMTPKYTKKKEGNVNISGFGYEDLDRWRICKNRDTGALEIWVAQPDPWGGYPMYRLWPEPDDFYTK